LGAGEAKLFDQAFGAQINRANDLAQ
jgi:hypothetical protein